MRAKTLSSYAGQAALPGGKADSHLESPVQTARREAYEEIGLPMHEAGLPPPFRIHHLCQLPMNLAKTELGVRPCVAYIETDPTRLHQPAGGSSEPRVTRSGGRIGSQKDGAIPAVEDVLIPRLDAKEVAAVFTAPFEAFLEAHLDETTMTKTKTKTEKKTSHAAVGALEESASDVLVDDESSPWYSGIWTSWHGTSWRMHNFYVPSSEQPVSWAEPPSTTMTMNRFRVFGMTARILVDAARVAFGREPGFEHNSHFGDEDMIGRLIRQGSLKERISSRTQAGGAGVVVVVNQHHGNENDQDISGAKM